MTPLAVTFTTPLAFLGLLLIPVLIAAIWAREKRPRRDVIRSPAASPLQAIVAGEPRWPRYVPPALLALAILALTLSFAKPERTVTVADRQASGVLVAGGAGG